MVLKDRRSDKTKSHFLSSEFQKIKMQVFGLAFILYYLKLSDGSGFIVEEYFRFRLKTKKSELCFNVTKEYVVSVDTLSLCIK